jgi:hypothetical protein
MKKLVAETAHAAAPKVRCAIYTRKSTEEGSPADRWNLGEMSYLPVLFAVSRAAAAGVASNPISSFASL